MKIICIAFLFILSLSLPEWRAMMGALVRLGSGAKRGLTDMARQAERAGAKAAAGAMERVSGDAAAEELRIPFEQAAGRGHQGSAPVVVREDTT